MENFKQARIFTQIKHRLTKQISGKIKILTKPNARSYLILDLNESLSGTPKNAQEKIGAEHVDQKK